MFKNRLTLGYLVLVGVPLLFLVSTLRAGRTLTAPPAISGSWAIQPVDAGQQIAPVMNIYQTGTDLQIALHDAKRTQFSARLENGRVVAGAMVAALGGQPGRRFLEGQLSVDGCPSCTPVRFRATKSVTPEK